ncbi:MAG TPA: hypothetical protein VFG80_09665, partial [Myxococcota bacterium]|nr:hypothetical protein [Myxococcota bacterium]
MRELPALPPLERLDDPAPHARFLSNGRYTLCVTGAGTGCSSCAGIQLTAWRPDRTQDADGVFVYLRDLDAGQTWSLGHQPVQAPADRYAARHEPGRVTIERTDLEIDAKVELCVASEDDCEIRRIRLVNRSRRPRRIEVTSCATIVLDLPAAAAAHPAFSKLFVETAFDPERSALLARRRPRANEERWPTLWCVLAGAGPLEWETDRARFLGRGRSPSRPEALATRAALSGSFGSVLDPVLALRRWVELPPGGEAELALVLGVAPDRDAALDFAGRHADLGGLDARFAEAGARERERIREAGLDEARAEYLQELLGALVYEDPRLRSARAVAERSVLRLAELRELGVDPERPLVVVGAEDRSAEDLLAELGAARAYWSALGCDVDLRELREIPPAQRPAALAFAHAVIEGSLPALEGASREDRLARAPSPASLEPPRERPGSADAPPASHEDARVELLFDNGCGGFARGGSEYRIEVPGDASAPRPPMPWINVVANERFGCLVSESGAGYTWSQNSRENRLTPWANDPILDPHGEALWLRDEEDGAGWSPLPGPAPDAEPYEVRHGFGYTRSRHASRGLEQELVLFVPRRDPVKIARVRLTNRSGRARHVSVFSFARLVMGSASERIARFVATELDEGARLLLARNRLEDDCGERVVFAAAAPPPGADPVRFTGDRAAFLGRHGSLERPAALRGEALLDGRTGAGLDPCAGLQVRLRIARGETVECSFLLGEAPSPAAAREIVARQREPGAVERALDEVQAFWRETTSALRVLTPS